jgi:hypothetical protein
MAFGFVASRGTQNVGATGTVTLAAATGAGNPLVMAVAWNPNTASLTAGTDSKGNTWTLIKTLNSASKSTGFIYCNPATPLAIGDTVSPSFSGSGRTSVVSILAEFSGGVVTLDGLGFATGAGGNASANNNVGAAANIGLVAIGTPSTAPGDYAVDTGWTAIANIQHATVGLCLGFHYKLNLAPGANTVTNVPVVGSAWAEILADLIAGGTAPPMLTDLMPMVGAS